MPYSLRKKNSKCWEVINTQSGKVHSKCTSKKKGEAQIRLLDQLHQQQGAGWFGDLISKVIPKKRAAGVLPPKVRKLLESVGNEAITSLVVVRTPLDKFLTGVVNAISLGSFKKQMKANSYDEMFHLTLFINNKYQYEKLEVVSLKTGNPVKSNSEMKTVDIPAGWNATIQQFIDKHKQEMGDERFSDYDPFKNNCQDFLIAALKANGLLTSELQGFIKQPVEKMVENMPSFTTGVSKGITDIAARVNRLIEGEGQAMTSLRNRSEVRRDNQRLRQRIDQEINRLRVSAIEDREERIQQGRNLQNERPSENVNNRMRMYLTQQDWILEDDPRRLRLMGREPIGEQEEGAGMQKGGFFPFLPFITEAIRKGGKISIHTIKMEEQQKGGFLPALALALAPTILGKILGNGIHGKGMQKGGFLPALALALAPTLLSKLFGGEIQHGRGLEDKINKLLPPDVRSQLMDVVENVIQNVIRDEDFSNLTGQAKRAYDMVKQEVPGVVRPIEDLVSREVIPRVKKVRKVIRGEGVPRKTSSWVSALKQWNAQKGGKYTIPKKGSKEYEQVRKLMK